MYPTYEPLAKDVMRFNTTRKVTVKQLNICFICNSMIEIKQFTIIVISHIGKTVMTIMEYKNIKQK